MKPSIVLEPTEAILTDTLGPLLDEAYHASGRGELVAAVAFARGIEGRMQPAPDAADPSHAFALLRFAYAIQTADVDEVKA